MCVREKAWVWVWGRERGGGVTVMSEWIFFMRNYLNCWRSDLTQHVLVLVHVVGVVFHCVCCYQQISRYESLLFSILLLFYGIQFHQADTFNSEKFRLFSVFSLFYEPKTSSFFFFLSTFYSFCIWYLVHVLTRRKLWIVRPVMREQLQMEYNKAKRDRKHCRFGWYSSTNYPAFENVSIASWCELKSMQKLCRLHTA